MEGGIHIVAVPDPSVTNTSEIVRRAEIDTTAQLIVDPTFLANVSADAAADLEANPAFVDEVLAASISPTLVAQVEAAVVAAATPLAQAEYNAVDHNYIYTPAPLGAFTEFVFSPTANVTSSSFAGSLRVGRSFDGEIRNAWFWSAQAANPSFIVPLNVAQAYYIRLSFAIPATLPPLRVGARKPYPILLSVPQFATTRFPTVSYGVLTVNANNTFTIEIFIDPLSKVTTDTGNVVTTVYLGNAVINDL